MMSETDILRKSQAGGIFAVRYILCMMLALSCFLLYAMRLSLSVSIVAMLNQTAKGADVPSDNESCRATVAPQNGTIREFTPGEFDWSQNEQAMITYAFFVGYLVSQIPGGYLAESYSSTWVLAVGAGLTSFLTCMTSVAAKHSLYTFIALRVFEGICEGVMLPAVYVFVSQWVPVEEQSFLLNLILSGSVVGVVVAMPVSALLCESYMGWPSSFYIFGIIGIVWSVVWLLIAADSPEKHRWVSSDEHEYIVEHRPPQTKDQTEPVPWKKILLSPAVLLLGLTNFGGSLNVYIMLTELPSFLNFMYGIRIDDNGWINGGMNLALAISMVGTGAIVDALLARDVFSKNFIRKFCDASSTLISSACLLIVAVSGCNYYLVVGILLINCVSLGFSGGGGNSIPLDLAPKYAGTVQGIVNLINNAAGVIAPLFVGQLTNQHNTLARWNLVFAVTAVVSTLCGLPFWIFGSTDEQSWGSDTPRGDGLIAVSEKDEDDQDRS